MLSIIIPTLNEEKYLPKLLDCLKAQTFQDFEIIVADANSSDLTRDIAKEYGAKVVAGGIPSVARNNGFKVSKGETIIFIDADITFDSEMIEKSLKIFNEKKLDIACCKYDTKGESFIVKNVYKIWDTGKNIRQWSNKPIGTTQFLIVKRQLFEHIKGFDEKLRVGEDVELIQRAVSHKYKFRILNVKISASSRRLQQAGVLAVMVAGLLATIYIGKKGVFFSDKLQTKLEKLYGGWGKNN